MNKIIKDRIKLIRNLEKLSTQGFKKEFVDKLTTDIRNDENRLLSFSQDSTFKVSFASKPEYKFDNERRTKTTFGKYLRKHMGYGLETIFDYNLAKIVSLLHATQEHSELIEIVKGIDLIDAYRNCIGGGSCMTGDNIRYLDMYKDNPGIIQLLIYRGEIQARALLWTTTDGHIVIDRIYPNSGNHVEAIREWGRKRGYYNRGHESCSDANIHTPDGNIAYGLQVIVEADEDMNFPYIDTFKYGEFCDDCLTLSNEYSLEICFTETNGGHSSADCMRCSNCGERIHEDNVYYGGDDCLCEYCYNELYIWCEWCEEDADRDDTTYVNCLDISICDSCLDNALANGKLFKCCECDIITDEPNELDDEIYCNHCYSNFPQCDKCKERFEEINKKCINGLDLCNECKETAEEEVKEEYIKAHQCKLELENESLTT